MRNKRAKWRNSRTFCVMAGMRPTRFRVAEAAYQLWVEPVLRPPRYPPTDLQGGE
jgi:hypothetical protein